MDRVIELGIGTRRLVQNVRRAKVSSGNERKGLLLSRIAGRLAERGGVFRSFQDKLNGVLQNGTDSCSDVNANPRGRIRVMLMGGADLVQGFANHDVWLPVHVRNGSTRCSWQ